METFLVTGIVRAGGLLVRGGISLLCGVVWLCSSACSSNLGSNRQRRRKSAATHRCFLFLINLTSVLLGIIIVQSGFSGLVATDSGVAGFLDSGHYLFTNISSGQMIAFSDLIKSGKDLSEMAFSGLTGTGSPSETPSPSPPSPAPHLNPFAVVVAAGSSMLLFSSFGLCGSCCALSKNRGDDAYGPCFSNKLLFAYYVAILISSAGLVFAALLCFAFADKATEYMVYAEALLLAVNSSAPLPLIGPIPVSDAERRAWMNAHTVGGICAAAAALNVICARSGAAILGYDWTARRTLLASNLVSAALGIGIIALAFLPAVQQASGEEQWLPKTIGGLGGAVCALSVLGLLATVHQSKGLLTCNATCLGVVCSAMLALGAYAVHDGAAAKGLVRDKLLAIKERFVDICPACKVARPDFEDCCMAQALLLVSDQVAVLGLAACVTVFFLFVNITASVYLCCRVSKERAKHDDDSEDEEEELIVKKPKRKPKKPTKPPPAREMEEP